MAEPSRLRAAELWRYPVKSLRGERLERADFDRDGIRGDRLLRVEGERGMITARTRPALLGVATGIGAGGEPEIAGAPWRSERAGRAVATAAPGARLTSTADAAPGERFDLSPVLVLTTSMVAELGVDFRRLRPNVLIEGARGREEVEWVGALLRLGDAELRVTGRCERCVMTTFDPDTIEQDPGVLERINSDFGRRIGLHCEVVRAGAASRGGPVAIERG